MKMNFAAVLKPAQTPLEPKVQAPKYVKEGWVNLRDFAARNSRAEEDDGRAMDARAMDARAMDARLKEAAVVMRRRWDRWNHDHGVDYDYDRECSCSEGPSDDDDGGDGWGDDAWGDDRGELFDRDYQCTKKTTLHLH